MTRKHFVRTFLALAVVAMLTSPLLASTPNTGPKPWNSDDGPVPSEVSRTMTCKIVEVEPPRTVVLLDLDAEREYIVPLQEDVPLKARRKSDFGGKKRLEFSDLEPGQIVRLTYATADRRILRVKVVGPGDES